MSATMLSGLTQENLDAFRELLRELECALCRNVIRDPYSTECQHTFCSVCITRYLRDERRACPTCLTPHILDQVKPNPMFAATITGVLEIKSALSTVAVLDKPNSHANKIEPTEIACDEDDEDEMMKESQGSNGDQLSKLSATTEDKLPSTMSLLPDTQLLEEQRITMERKIMEVSAKFPSSSNTRPGVPNHNSTSTTTVKTIHKILTSGISGSVRLKQINELVQNIGGAEMVSSISQTNIPTHLIVGAKEDSTGQWTCRPTTKYYLALSAGCWIVREQWIDECEKRGRWVDENEFQVYAYTAKFDTSTSMRTTKLFRDKLFYFGPFAEISLIFTKEQSKALLELNGAQVVDLGGNHDGSDMRLLDSALLEQSDNKERVIIVGHPKVDPAAHTSHASCTFCANISYQLQRHSLNDITVVECAWIMLCLDNMRYCDYSDRILV